MGPFGLVNVNGTADKLGLPSSNKIRLRLTIHQISTPMRRTPSTPPTTPPTIGPTSVWLSFDEVGAVEVDMVLDRELEGLVVEDEDPNGAPMSLPVVAISCASVLLNCILFQSLGSS